MYSLHFCFCLKKTKELKKKNLVVVYKMGCSVWTVNLFVFVNSSITFTAVMKHFTSVAISTQHFIASYRAFQDAQNSLIRICNMRVYTYNSKLTSFFVGNTGFISDPILRAGDGCFSLASGIIVLFMLAVPRPILLLELAARSSRNAP
jgi:hypothetical protein